MSIPLFFAVLLYAGVKAWRGAYASAAVAVLVAFGVLCFASDFCWPNSRDNR